jgi:hypothetical protein
VCFVLTLVNASWSPPEKPNMDIRQELEQIRAQANWAAGAARQAFDLAKANGDRGGAEQIVAEHQRFRAELTGMANVIASLKMERIGGTNGDPNVQRIENIPGTRVPFDMLVEIPIDAASTDLRQGTITVSMEGPFVAEARMCTFLSQFQFQRTDPVNGQITSFLGRSNGRFRPIHSAADHNDALLMAETTRAIAMPGTGAPSYASPSNHAPFRTMEGDFRVTVRKQDDGFPRSNISVPSTFWTTYVNSPFELAALDFFPRASIIEFSVTPQHINNPSAGNLQAYGAGAVFPFIGAQFDHHEGIQDPLDATLVAGDPDPITRLPKGVLILGFRGYRIFQAPGAVVNLSSV